VYREVLALGTLEMQSRSARAKLATCQPGLRTVRVVAFRSTWPASRSLSRSADAEAAGESVQGHVHPGGDVASGAAVRAALTDTCRRGLAFASRGRHVGDSLASGHAGIQDDFGVCQGGKPRILAFRTG
jgi:hypothetical protein